MTTLPPIDRNMSSHARRVITSIMPAMRHDLRGCPGDVGMPALEITGLRQWWDKQYRARFNEPSGIIRGKGRNQFDMFVSKIGTVTTARNVLGFLLDNWGEFRDSWNLTGNPTPGFFLGFRNHIAASFRESKVLPLLGTKEEPVEVEFGEWV